ncbi:OsmC family protein [Marivirga sp. S37H4]|uniref:OsmC family protein n=1 Tax=Marivirga aurantiaca TaxID=2802615 RepID=A0A934WVP8_9BACT|nr:OsmC family protein [Marivirga aurantiaca]MBK6263790.1 OsmC family protein [Marivirga aurantiaca]
MSHLLKFRVASQSESAAKTAIQVRGFKFFVDEPQALGGTNLAPNPVEYILAGYAGCINVVAHIVAKELGISLKDLSINIQGDINPERLFGRSFSHRAGYQSIEVNIKTSTIISNTLKVKWLKSIESRCPVNDNLSNVTPINFQFSNN